MQQALDRFRGFLRERSLRATDERDTIVKAALARKGHFDIEELAADLAGCGISRATVYRALPLLMEAGIVQPAVTDGHRRKYEAAFGGTHHDHLVCSRCGEVVEFRFEAFEMLQRELAAKYGYRLTAHYHEIIGECPECQAKP